MKKILKITVTVTFFLFSALVYNLNADCHSPNGMVDNRHCDTSDFSNKKCVKKGSPINCFIDELQNNDY